jgi:hypothetical protein
MKFIKLLRTVQVGELYLKKGSTCEVSAELADRLIAAKSAELVKAAAK